MSKMYIRTKNGVYEVSHYNDWATHKRKGATLIDGDKISYIKNEDIIKQSDPIEELCDEFVIEYLASEEVIQIRYPEFQWAKEDFESNKKGTLYGAIRVAGKGLIYVAKMNDDGKLELI